MDVNKKKEAIKKWARDHREDLITGAFVTSILGTFVTFVVYANKAENRAIDEYNAHQVEVNDWLNEERANGNRVYALADGTALTVPFDAPQKTYLM